MKWRSGPPFLSERWRHVLPQCKGPFCTTATLPFWLCVFNPIKGMFRAHVERTFAYKSKCTLIAKFSGRTNAFLEFTILPSRVALAQRFAYENSFFFHESLGPMANLAGPPQKIPLFNVDAGVAIRSVSKRVRPSVTSQLVENTLHFSQSMYARNIKKHQETSRNHEFHQMQPLRSYFWYSTDAYGSRQEDQHLCLQHTGLALAWVVIFFKWPTDVSFSGNWQQIAIDNIDLVGDVWL